WRPWRILSASIWRRLPRRNTAPVARAAASNRAVANLLKNHSGSITMRLSSLACLTTLSLFFLPCLGSAQQRKRVEFDQVQIGFGASKPLAKLKSGCWTPVYIYLKGGAKESEKGEFVIESSDSDEVRSRYTVPMLQFNPDNPEEVQLVVGYTRPARADVTITALINGRVVNTYQEDCAWLELGNKLCVTLGSRWPSWRPVMGKKNPQKSQKLDNADADEVDEGDYRRGPRQVSGIEDISMLPKSWFAYEPVDCILLSTGRREFMTNLLNEREG